MKLTLVCLRTTRHSDSRSILTAFSREQGRVALGIPAGNGREARRLRALTMPLAVLECETTARPGREVMPLRQGVALKVTPSLHSNPVKQMMAMFVAEVIEHAVRHGGADAALFDMVVGAAEALDRADEAATANFHLCFLSAMARVTGIEPDMSTYKKGRLLDLRDGVWRPTAPLHNDCLSSGESDSAAMLMRMTFANMRRYRYTPFERRHALDTALRYIGIHLAPMQGLKSLSVLRSFV